MTSFDKGGFSWGDFPQLPITEKYYNDIVENEKNEIYLNNISYLKEEDLTKPNIEDYQKIYRCLDGENYYTYMIHIQNLLKSKNVNLEEIDFYKNIIKELMNEEKIKYSQMVEESNVEERKQTN